MTLQNGQRVGDHYEVARWIGSGGMAEVYELRHDDGGRFAMKVLRVGSGTLKARLLSEGRTQQELSHPNIVGVCEVVEVGGNPALVLEYVDGPSLHERLGQGKLTVAEADTIAQGILAGVAAAHAASIVHRDLKPGNVLLARVGGVWVPKVADFGLAKVLDDEAPTGSTRTGVALGTPSYMAPEQFRDAKRVDPRADVFSLGALLYELVAGRKAFRSTEDLIETWKLVSTGDYAPLDEVVPGIPRRMKDAIDAALEPDRDRRPADASVLWALWTGARSPNASGDATLAFTLHDDAPGTAVLAGSPGDATDRGPDRSEPTLPLRDEAPTEALSSPAAPAATLGTFDPAAPREVVPVVAPAEGPADAPIVGPSAERPPAPTREAARSSQGLTASLALGAAALAIGVALWIGLRSPTTPDPAPPDVVVALEVGEDRVPEDILAALRAGLPPGRLTASSTPPEVAVSTLPNGIRLQSWRTHRLPVFEAAFAFRTDDAADPTVRDGAMHALAFSLARMGGDGPDGRAAALRELGATIVAHGEKGGLVFEISGPADNFGAIVAEIARGLRDPAYGDQDLTLWKTDYLNWSPLDPFSILALRAARNRVGIPENPNRRAVVDTVTVDQIRERHRASIRPDRLEWMVDGVEPQAAKAALTDALGDWAPGGQAAPLVQARLSPGPGVWVFPVGVPDTAWTGAFPVSDGGRLVAVAAVAATVRLHQDPLTQGCRLDLVPGAIDLSCQPTPGQMAPTLAALRSRLLETLSGKPLVDDEITAGLNHAASFARPSAGSTLLQVAVSGWVARRTLPEQLAVLDQRDDSAFAVNQAWRDHVDPGLFAWVALGDPADVGAQLEAAGVSWAVWEPRP